MPITIRTAQADDIPALITLRAYLLDHGDATYAATDEYARLAWREAYRQWLLPRIGQADVLTLVAEASGPEPSLVGMVTGIIDQRPPGPDCLTGRTGWVQSLVVETSRRREGISSALMHELMAWFTSQEASKVVLHATAEA
ncbi:MAG: GNAT family N-acetyltransferase, partial [Brevibacterium aurantiacum]